MPSFHFDLLRVPVLMGIVNVTPDSFSDGGLDDAMGRLEGLVVAGAAIVDLGAEASSFFRAGVVPVGAEEQLRRLLPVLGKLPGGGREYWVSVDTRSAVVAKEAIRWGVDIVNDVSAGRDDSEMLPMVAESGVGVVLMHRGASFPESPLRDDLDIFGSVRDFLAERVAAAMAAGISREKIAVDPGLGFGKTVRDNWELALRAHELQVELGLPVVMGASRKRFLETPPPMPPIDPAEWRALLERFVHLADTHPRDPATAALTLIAMRNGVAVHRLHRIWR